MDGHQCLPTIIFCTSYFLSTIVSQGSGIIMLRWQVACFSLASDWPFFVTVIIIILTWYTSTAFLAGSKLSLQHPPYEYFLGTVRLVSLRSLALHSYHRVLLEDSRRNREEDMRIPLCYNKDRYEIYGVLRS